MSNVVFILGAGASKQAGAPLMANFLDVATDLLRSGQVNDKREHFERVFTAIGGLQAVHSKAQLDLNNIESIFTALELGRIIKRVPGIDDHLLIPDRISSLKELIVNTLEATIVFPRRQSNIFAPKPYDEFAALIKYLLTKAFPQQSVSILSFNYDISIDFALYREQLGINYVIEPPPTNSNSVDLLKLHGSLNWATETKTRRIRPLHLHHYFKKYQYIDVDNADVKISISSSLHDYFSRQSELTVEVDPEPVIVPPSWNKADYHQALSDVWASAANHLSEAENIFIIGYSLPETDSFFRHLYALGSAGKSALRRFIVFNPDRSGETDSRFRALLGPGSIARYEYLPMTFDESIKHINNLFPTRN